MTEIGEVIVMKAHKPLGNVHAIIAPSAISATVTHAHTRPWFTSVVMIAATQAPVANNVN